MAFENPCDKCEKAKNGEDCTTFQKCKEYRYWLNYNFKMARINARKRKEEMPKVTKFTYQHPDMARKYLKDGVCSGCPFEGECNDPCKAYLEWYNARMKYFRVEAGL